jgi:mxaJ protein
MSSHSSKNGQISRRACLQWAAATAALPAVARAICPCAIDISASQPPAASAATKPAALLKVCADPNNLPFSNREHAGFEDKIAAIIARDIGLPLEYEWLPQRLGFYRTALKTFDCNLVMAAPAGFEKALITQPYYRSSYVFVYRSDSKNPIHSFDDPALRTVKIGIPLTGGYNTPPTHALAKRKLTDHLSGFPVFDESEGKPGERIIAAVASGEIDLAIAWGPQAGYFAQRQAVPLEVVRVLPHEDVLGEAKVPFTFDICMALRRPDKQLRNRINEAIVRSRSEIEAILDEYHVPRLAAGSA